MLLCLCLHLLTFNCGALVLVLQNCLRFCWVIERLVVFSPLLLFALFCVLGDFILGFDLILSSKFATKRVRIEYLQVAGGGLANTRFSRCFSLTNYDNSKANSNDYEVIPLENERIF